MARGQPGWARFIIRLWLSGAGDVLHEQTGRLFLCARCQAQVLVCSQCDRGHRYCANGCVNITRRSRQREAGERCLRACDLVRLRVREISHGDRVSTRAIVMQQKTSRPVQFEITPPTRDAVTAWIKEAKLVNDDFLFPSRVHESPHLGTRQYARILDCWIEEIGLDPTAYGPHTIRRTKASLIYRRAKNIRAVQLLLGHNKLESTVRYLGIEVEDALELSEQTEI